MAAYLRIDSDHQAVVDLLLSSSRTSSLAARAKTGPFSELRQVVVLAAALGATLNRDRPPGASDQTIRDTVLLEAKGALELSFALAYRRAQWDLGVIADGEESLAARVNALEEYACGGLDFLAQRLTELGATTSALELLMDAKKQVTLRDAELPASEATERDEDPVIAALRRRGKLRNIP
jgi:hypothetical protein